MVHPVISLHFRESYFTSTVRYTYQATLPYVRLTVRYGTFPNYCFFVRFRFIQSLPKSQDPM